MRPTAPRKNSSIRWSLFAIIVILAVPSSAGGVSFKYFVQFQGIEYAGTRFEEGRQVKPDDLGPEIGRVVCNIVDLYSPASGGMAPSAASAKAMKECAERDGGASMLRVGTPVYTMRGYRPSYRLAANTGHQWMIFHVGENPRANVGADIFDLDTKVQAVTLRLEDPRTPRSPVSVRVEAEADVEAIVSLVKAAPVARRSDSARPYYGQLPYRYWITFWFKDGTAHGIAYFADTGWLGPGLSVSAAFRRFVEDRLAPLEGDLERRGTKGS